MGVPKGLLSFNGKPWLLEQLDAYRRAGGKRAVVVLGYNSDAYLNELSFLKMDKETHRGSLRITTILNQKPEFGPFSTVQTGLFRLREEARMTMAFLAIDRPAPPPEIWQMLTNSLSGNVQMIFPIREEEDGHPVMVTRSFADKIIATSSEEGRMDVLRLSLPEGACIKLAVADEKAGININTPESWEDYKKTHRIPSLATHIISGMVGTGKTTKIREEIKELEQRGLKVGGIIQPRKDENYFVQDIQSGEKRLLAEKLPEKKNGMGFSFHPETWVWAAEKIRFARTTCDVLAVDELGRLEAEGKGHMPAILEKIPSESVLARLFTVREDRQNEIKRFL